MSDLKKYSIFLFACLLYAMADAQVNNDLKTHFGLLQSDIQWMRDATIDQLDGCRVKSTSGLLLHTPDGIGNYKALWTRDFYYMVAYAGDLLNADEIKASIKYLLGGQREDGCIPDRVNILGKPVYSPGGENRPMADHALDNGPFMALLVCSYVNQFGDEALFREAEGKLKKGLDFISRAENGLVYNDPQNPQCPYGFTDVVKKTGHLLFSSLLYYHASKEMELLCRRYNLGNAESYREQAEKIRKSIHQLRDKKSGMYWAADIDCKQIDIWGSAYAVNVGITNKAQSKKVAKYLVDHSDQLVMKGQVRHLPGSDQGWNRLFHDVAEGTYQNGAYWATPLAWVIPVIAQQDLSLAQKMLKDVIQDFQRNGINECINTDYLKVPNYVVSATNVYFLTK